jgi:hypothetical protein
MGCSFWPLCTPAWTVQKTEYSAPQAPPVPLQLSNIAEIDVILGSDVARGTLVCLDELCLPTQIAGRRRLWDQYGVSGAYAAALAC